MEVNPRVVVEKLPAAIDEIQATFGPKFSNLADAIEEWAKETGIQNNIETAAAARRVIEAAQEYVKRLCGEEGDKMTETGTFHGFVQGAKVLLKAAGEEA